MSLALEHDIRPGAPAVKITKRTLAVTLPKADPALRWAALGKTVLDRLDVSHSADDAAADGEQAGAAAAFAPLTLLETAAVNHDTSVFRFRTPPGWSFPPGAHIRVRGGDGDAACIRSYTPIELFEPLGTPAAVVAAPGEAGEGLTLLVKRYDDGAMSRHIHALAAGATLECSRAVEPLEGFDPQSYRSVIFIAGGTGLWGLETD